MENNTDDIATNEKVNKYIPDDISFFILSKLPHKSLKRFESVCKSWSLLFENTHFMNMFRKNFVSNSHSCSYYDGASLLLRVSGYKYKSRYSYYSLSGERFENKVKLNFKNSFANHPDFDIFGFGSINGTLCLQEQYRDYGKIVLWNPFTQSIKLLPHSLIEDSMYLPDEAKKFVMKFSYLSGFGYDHVLDDYKVIRCVCLDIVDYYEHPSLRDDDLSWLGGTRFDPLWEIYSLKSNSWRELHVNMPYSLDHTGDTQAYMDGVCHWLCKKITEDNPAGPCLVSFYLSNELFSITPIPLDVDHCFDVKAEWINLAALNGFIALISFHIKTTTFHISILGEFGIKESWTKLFIVGSLPCVEKPIGVGTKGEIFFLRKNKKVAWFNLSTQMIEELGYKAETFDCKIINYKEIILPFEK